MVNRPFEGKRRLVPGGQIHQVRNMGIVDTIIPPLDRRLFFNNGAEGNARQNPYAPIKVEARGRESRLFLLISWKSLYFHLLQDTSLGALD